MTRPGRWIWTRNGYFGGGRIGGFWSVRGGVGKAVRARERMAVEVGEETGKAVVRKRTYEEMEEELRLMKEERWWFEREAKEDGNESEKKIRKLERRASENVRQYLKMKQELEKKKDEIKLMYEDISMMQMAMEILKERTKTKIEDATIKIIQQLAGDC